MREGAEASTTPVCSSCQCPCNTGHTQTSFCVHGQVLDQEELDVLAHIKDVKQQYKDQFGELQVRASLAVGAWRFAPGASLPRMAPAYADGAERGGLHAAAV